MQHNGETIEYIEVTCDDIAKADELAKTVFARCYKELPDKTEQILMAIVEMVHTYCVDHHVEPADYRFTRKSISQFLQKNEMAISATHLKRHLAMLEEYEYLIVHTGGGRGRLKTYQLDYETPPTTKEVHRNGQKSTSSPSEVLDFSKRQSFGKNGQKRF